MSPETRYAKSGEVHIAYQVFGDGAANLVMTPPYVSNVESYWEFPEATRWLERLGRYAKVAIFDKRGTGMSDRVSDLPGIDVRMDDLRAVMDAAGMSSAAQFGVSEGGSLSAMFAATYPERSSSLVLYGSFARFSSWVPTDEAFEQLLAYVENAWGSGGSIAYFGPSHRDDPAARRWWGRFERLGASPSACANLMKMNREIDISGILGSIRVPTLVLHRTDDAAIGVEVGRYLASHIPNARYIEFPGADHMPMFGDNAEAIADAIGEFLTGAKARDEHDTILATVLFTDIVGSTELAAALGDRRWRDLLVSHHRIVRRNIERFRGREIKSTGDGFLATFDGPARGVRCACSIQGELQSQGIPIREGLHTGECELLSDDIGGLAVHIGARVASLAKAGEVLVSSTVKDLIAGAGLRFDSRGVHLLKGVPGEWSLFAVHT
jgi:class 3 adenylate cyclase